MQKGLETTRKGLETTRKLTRGGRLTLLGAFRREKVNSPARVTLAGRYGWDPGNPGCLVNTTKTKR